VKPPAEPPEKLSLKNRFRQKVEEKSQTTALYLERIETIREEEKQLVIEVSNKVVATALDSTEHKKVLEAAAGELLGKEISVSHIMDGASEGTGEGTSAASLRDSVKNEALVQSFLEVFRGDIKHVKSAKDSTTETGK
jgi:hypothetical protein